jgi:hypothetical protein
MKGFGGLVWCSSGLVATDQRQLTLCGAVVALICGHARSLHELYHEVIVGRGLHAAVGVALLRLIHVWDGLGWGVCVRMDDVYPNLKKDKKWLVARRYTAGVQ